MPRRTKTARPINISCKCNFSLTIKADSSGFFLHNTGYNGKGIPTHKNHIRLDSTYPGHMPSRLLTPEIILQIHTLNSVHACTGIGRDVALKNHHAVLSLQQVRYLRGFTNTHDPELPIEENSDSSSSTDKLIKHLCDSGKNDVCILQHTITSSSDLLPRISTNEETKEKKGTLIDACIEGSFGSQQNFTHIVPLDKNEYQDMAVFAEEKRTSQKCSHEQHLMIGIAWVSRSARRWFRLFPQVLFIDVTEDSNKESRPFLTVSVKDSSGHHHIVLRAFLPNQRAWSFRWVFQRVMPRLLSVSHPKNVQMLLTDGDSQETSQLDVAISKFFPHATRRRCAYHMVCKRWESSGVPKRVPAGLNGTKEDRAKIMKMLSAWHYSWSDPRAETAAEMDVSVALFLEYLKSEKVREVLTSTDVEQILKMTRESILALDEYFAFYRFMTIRCYDARTTSGHEGTNLALKHGSTALRPNQSLEKASAIIEQKENNQNARASVKAFSEYLKTKLWTDSSTSQSLISMGEGLLRDQTLQSQISGYIFSQIKSDKFQALYRITKKRNDQCNQTIIGSQEGLGIENWFVQTETPIPVFHRVRIVHVLGGTAFCSCHYFERFGIPCRHILHIVAAVNPQHCISHHDVSVVYWSSYCLFAHDDDRNEHQELSMVLSALAQCDIKGPRFPEVVVPQVMCEEESSMLPKELILRHAECSVLNWPYEAVRRAIQTTT